MLNWPFSIRHLLEKKKEEAGFTLVELIIASAMSLALLGTAYSFLNSTMRMNKVSQRNMQMNAELTDAITELTDEIKSGRLLVFKLNQFHPNCKRFIDGDLVLGIKFPPQALKASDYKPRNKDVDNLDDSFGCPIIYTIKPGQEEMISDQYKISSGYILFRYGPSISEKGYYTNKGYIMTPILYNIKEKPIINIECEGDFISRQIKGISLCTDIYGKYAEIGISTEITHPGSGTSQSFMSTGAFSRITNQSFRRENLQEFVESQSFVHKGTYIEKGCSAYLLVDGPSWSEARAYAQMLGGDLVSIKDAEENEFIVNSYKNFEPAPVTYPLKSGVGNWSRLFYIGINDKEIDGVFQWSDSSSITYTNWGHAGNWTSGGRNIGMISLDNSFAPWMRTGRWAMNVEKEVANLTGLDEVSGIVEIPLCN